MGSSSSKAARKLPTKVSPIWAGARTPSAAENGGSRRPLKAHASENKDEAILQDAMDPQLLANLNRLGPVKVDHHSTTDLSSTHMKNLLRTREISEQQAFSSKTTHNRLRASTLAELLHEYRAGGTQGELQRLADKYSLDKAVLERLVPLVNNPTYRQDSVERIVGEDGQERVTMQATWSEASGSTLPPSIR